MKKLFDLFLILETKMFLYSETFKAVLHDSCFLYKKHFSREPVDFTF